MSALVAVHGVVLASSAGLSALAVLHAVPDVEPRHTRQVPAIRFVGSAGSSNVGASSTLAS